MWFVFDEYRGVLLVNLFDGVAIIIPYLLERRQLGKRRPRVRAVVRELHNTSNFPSISLSYRDKGGEECQASVFVPALHTHRVGDKVKIVLLDRDTQHVALFKRITL